MLKVTQAVKTDLAQAFPGIVDIDVPMSKNSQWKVGGEVAALVRPRNKLEISKLRRWVQQRSLPSLVIGSTSNLLFCDKSIDVITIQLGASFSRVEVIDDRIIAEAGVWVPGLARNAMQASLAGIEHTCGIPGTLGGLVVMNGGSQRKSIGSNVEYVQTVDINGVLKRYNPGECQFSYRSSIFQNLNEVVIEVGLRLKKTQDRRAIHGEMLQILKSRSKKFPRKFPNVGSIFQSGPTIYEKHGPPGKIIEECGLKGLEIGGAKISDNHANFIINQKSAKAMDILALISIVQSAVIERIDEKLKIEPLYVDENGVCREIT